MLPSKIVSSASIVAKVGKMLRSILIKFRSINWSRWVRDTNRFMKCTNTSVRSPLTYNDANNSLYCFKNASAVCPKSHSNDFGGNEASVSSVFSFDSSKEAKKVQIQKKKFMDKKISLPGSFSKWNNVLRQSSAAKLNMTKSPGDMKFTKMSTVAVCNLRVCSAFSSLSEKDKV